MRERAMTDEVWYTKSSTRENLCRGSVALTLKAKFGLKDLSTTKVRDQWLYLQEKARHRPELEQSWRIDTGFKPGP